MIEIFPSVGSIDSVEIPKRTLLFGVEERPSRKYPVLDAGPLMLTPRLLLLLLPLLMVLRLPLPREVAMLVPLRWAEPG